MDWEAWLRSAKEPPSDNEDGKRSRTEQQIRQALSTYGPLRGRPYTVYAKGSYANNTNVRLNYDVDIAVEYTGFFYYDLEFELQGHPASEVGVVPTGDPYGREEFKADIQGALHAAFGRANVTPGRIAFRVRNDRTTLPADVVPCWEYRRYERISNGLPFYSAGSRVFTSDGGHKDNYPKIQKEEGTAKNNRTNFRYKWMVRALKRLQTRLVSLGLLDDELPSYLIECLVFNVPDESFGHATYYQDMRAVLAHIFNGTLFNGDSASWVEVHQLRFLFRPGTGWDVNKVHRLADVAWEHLGYE